MPCVRVFTNVDADKTTQMNFLKELSAIIAKLLKKPEDYVTVSVMANQSMLWGGKDIPCAQILLMSLGGLDAMVNSRISAEVQRLLKKHFNIASDNYYIQFCDCEGYMIGYDGSTF